MAERHGSGHTDIEHTSATQLGLMAKCGVAYEFQYIRGIKSPPSLSMLRGSAVDDAAANALRKKMETGEDRKPEDVRCQAIALFDVAMKDQYQPKDEDDIDRERMAVGNCALLFAELLLPDIVPAMVQQRVIVPFEVDGVRYDILGYLDWATVEHALRDLKTMLKSPAAGKADASRQMTIYKIGYRLETGEDPSSLGLECLVSLKTKTKLVTLLTERDYADELALFDVAERFMRAKHAGNFVAADPDHWVCSAKFCSNFYSCPSVSQWHRNRKGTGSGF